MPNDCLFRSGRDGSASDRVRAALHQLRHGGGVIVVDDENRENEGDMIFATDTLTAPQMALMIREGSGIVCLVLTTEHADALKLPPMVEHNTSSFGTGFTVSIEARNGVSSGVSAADRVTTVRAATNPDARPEDLARPGHVFPLRAHPAGLAGRQGHTEATIALMTMAGLSRSGVLCEVTNPDGSMARLPELRRFAERYAMPIVSIADPIGASNGEWLFATTGPSSCEVAPSLSSARTVSVEPLWEGHRTNVAQTVPPEDATYTNPLKD